MISLAILYTPRGGQPLRLVRVDDAELLIEVARTAVKRAEARAKAATEVDDLLGAAEGFEAEKIRRTLFLFLPELRCDPEVRTGEGGQTVM